MGGARPRQPSQSFSPLDLSEIPYRRAAGSEEPDLTFGAFLSARGRRVARLLIET